MLKKNLSDKSPIQNTMPTRNTALVKFLDSKYPAVNAAKKPMVINTKRKSHHSLEHIS